MRGGFIKSVVRLFCAICFVGLCLSEMQVSAAPEKYPLEIPNTNVRVGMYPQEGFHDYYNGFPVGGYGYDYLQHLRAYAPWTYQYFGSQLDWPAALKLLENGKIDMLLNVRKTPEREKKFAFSKIPMGQSLTILTVRSGDSRYRAGDYARWNGIRIGIPKSDIMKKMMETFARKRGFTYKVVSYENMPEMLGDLRAGRKIDAALSNNLRRLQNEWVLDQLDMMPFYIAVRRNAPKILMELDSAMAQLELNDPSLRSSMWKRYFAWTENKSVQFTEQELDFIRTMSRSGRVFTAVLNPDRYPLSYVENGVPRGTIRDIADEIIRRTGLSIRFLRVETPEEYQNACKNPNVDFVFDAKHNLREGEQNGLILSHPYISLTAFLLRNRASGQNPKSYVLIEGYRIAEFLKELLPPGVKIWYCKTTSEAVKLVASGKYDATCLHTSAAELAVRNDPLDRLESVLLPKLRINLSLGTRDTRNPLLVTVMNKSVASIGEDFVLETIRKNKISSSEVFSFARLVHRHPFVMFGMPLILLLVFCGLLARMLQQHKKAYRFGVVFRNLPFHYFFADVKGNLLQYDFGNESGKTPLLRTLDDIRDDAVRLSLQKLLSDTFLSGKTGEISYCEGDHVRSCIAAPVSNSLFGRPAVICVSRDITDLARSRDDARRNEEFFRQTLLSIGDGVIATDAHGNITMLNPVAERMMGVRLADTIGKPHANYFKIVNSEDGCELESPVLRTLRTGCLVELANHTDIISADGKERRHISDSSSPITGTDGKIIGVILVFRDVTEEYEHRREMASEISNWEMVAKIARIYHFKFNPVTGKIRKGDNVSEVWPLRNGFPVPPEEWIFPEDFPEWRKQYSAVVSGTQLEAIISFRVSDIAGMRYFRGYIRGEGVPNGELTGMLQELTSFVEAEQKQNALQALWHACLGNMPIILFIKSIDNGFRYVQCNDHYAEFIGRRVDEIIGRTDAELLSRPEDVEYIHEHDLGVVAAKKPVTLQENIADGTGRVRYYRTVKFCVSGLDGKPVLVGMSLDETEDFNRRRMFDNMLEDWENVANVARIGSFRVDCNMNILSATERMTRFWPAGPDGKPVTAEEYLLPEDAKIYNEMYASVFNGKQDQASMLCRVPRSDGMRYLRLYIKQTPLRKNEVSGLIQDVTVMIREQQKREALLSMWTNVVNTLPALFFVKNADEEFKYLQVNGNFCKHISSNPEKIIGRTEKDFFDDPRDTEASLEEDILTMNSGVRQEFLRKIRVKNGEIRHYRTVKIPSVDEEGRRILIAMSQDVSDEQELSEARKIISSAFETLFTSDNLEADMRVIMKNICEFIGFERAYIGCVDEKLNRVRIFSSYRPEGTKPMFDLSTFCVEHATTQPWFVNLLNTMREDVFHFDFSNERDRKLATYHVPSILEKTDEFDVHGVHINYILVKGRPWGCIGFITCGRPVKKLSHNETALLTMTAHIVELAITRKRTLDQLHGALNSALAADKAKTFFLSSMSHEIRTPLNAVIGFTDLLKDSGLDRGTREDYLKSVSDASQALLTLLNDILELSKLASSKVQTHPVMTDMRKFVTEMDSLFRPCAQQKHLTLDISAEGVPELFIDRPRIRQILFNLIGNAVKFTTEGGIKVRLGFKRATADSGILMIRVADTGIGIEPEDREKMFEPFIQMSRMRGTNASGTGTGLGLAIVKKIVEQSGGKLSLESEVGCGTTFSIEIPSVSLHPVVRKEKAQDAMLDFLPEPAVPPKDNRIPKVLIVDDADMVLEILSRMMDWMHVPHTKAHSAKEALDLLKKEPFDMMMTDLLMPEMNGAELAKIVRGDSRFSKMQIIAMSTENESIMYDRDLFDKVLLKPIVRNALYDGIFGKTEHGK